MIQRRPIFVALSLALCLTVTAVSVDLLGASEAAPVANRPAKKQLRTLPPPPKEGRFEMSYDRRWPARPGQPEVCLWADDKYAAVSITIDDNCQPDHDWWLKQGAKYGFRFTWFIVTGGVGEPKNSFAGRWEDFRQLREAGHDVQSHTVSHHQNDAERPDDEVRAEYRDSQQAIVANVPGSRAVCLSYPCGSGKPEIAAEYYVACRGVHGSANAANRINYLSTSCCNLRPESVDMILTGKHATVAWLTDPRNRRAWLAPVYHYVRAGGTPAEKDATQTGVAEELAHLASKKEQIWVGLFREVACYGMERDTSRIEVVKNTGEEIRFLLSDDMNDELFDYPLTIKVRLPATWNNITARQGGKSAAARVVEHDGGRFALVQAVPDRGEVAIVELSNRADGAVRLPSLEFLQVESAF